jgi:hypothetical protein
MSNNTKIFSEAIAEAKAIRETAMANAKLALEEAFAPRIQEMMSDKLEAMSQEEDEMKEDYGQAEADTINDEISLEELLAELEGLEEGEEEMEEGIGSAIKGAASNVSKGLEKAYDKIANAKPLFSDEPLEKFSKKFRKVMSGDERGYGLNREEVEENTELQEAMSTIATLRSELNEVNLLNAKLLYVNKLFKAKNLNEAQKVKVINAFDRAETVREAKNVFDTLNESLNTEKAKSQIKESLSFASKSAGVSDRQPIMEGDDFVNRMQKLAGII